MFLTSTSSKSLAPDQGVGLFVHQMSLCPVIFLIICFFLGIERKKKEIILFWQLMCTKINTPAETVFYAPSTDKYNCTSTQTVLKIGWKLHNVVTLLQCKLEVLAQINNLLSSLLILIFTTTTTVYFLVLPALLESSYLWLNNMCQTFKTFRDKKLEL